MIPAAYLPSPMDFPAAKGGIVTEGHAQVCRNEGHATYTINGEPAGYCPRCGESVPPRYPFDVFYLDGEQGFPMYARIMARDYDDAWEEAYARGYSPEGIERVREIPSLPFRGSRMVEPDGYAAQLAAEEAAAGL